MGLHCKKTKFYAVFDDWTNVMACRLRIQPRGGTANQLLQFMLAKNIERVADDVRVTGCHIPEWGVITAPDNDPDKAIELSLTGNSIYHDDVVDIIRKGLASNVVLKGHSFRISNYALPEFYRPIIGWSCENVTGYGSEHVVFHIRGGDILMPAHQDYYPIPFSYIDAVLKNTDASPVFVGQLEDSYYAEKLRERYPDAIYSKPQTAVEDFETLRRSSEIAVSISSFAWLAAWLSHATTIHLPVAGMLNPAQRPDIDLLPLDDPRYKFYRFDQFKWNATPSDIETLWQSRAHGLFSRNELAELKFYAARLTRAKSRSSRIKLYARAVLTSTADKIYRACSPLNWHGAVRR
ncbi:hypothetical protein [uncultured Agrobacterium sp.]|uniref:hypothetical protein n=1 Tax=uncultured Agrobacterium sp. TaxID=157277 RepID=UPI0025E34109|nr:hypothetical protein [uncultured Agrobacterium sp.]